MPATIESHVGGVWQAPQAALGTPTASNHASVKRLRKAGDDSLKAAKTIGSEQSVDGQAFDNAAQYVDSIGGAVGTITVQGQIETAGFLLGQVIGVDVVTGSSPDYTHTMAVSNVQGALQTLWQSVGQAVGPAVTRFSDARQSKVTVNCGQDQKVLHVVQDIIALKASTWVTTAPTASEATSDPFNWNEVETDTEINGVSVPEVDGDTVEIDRALDVHRGDSAKATCFVFGKGRIDRMLSAVVTDGTLPHIKSILWGSASPADGTEVATTVTTVALKTTYTRSSVRSLSIDTPKVAVKPEDFDLGPRAAGGKIPVTFGGQALKDGSTAALTVIAKTGDATAYV